MERLADAAVRLPAIGWPSQVDRISPMEPPRGVPVSNPPRLRDFLGFCGPVFAFRASNGQQRPAGRERSGRSAEPSEPAARAALGAALKPYGKFSQRHRLDVSGSA